MYFWPFMCCILGDFIVRRHSAEMRERQGGERGMTHVYGDPHRSWYLVFPVCISGADPTPGAKLENLKTCHKYILIILVLA